MYWIKLNTKHPRERAVQFSGTDKSRLKLLAHDILHDKSMRAASNIKDGDYFELLEEKMEKIEEIR